jgi:hypothetical protein
MNTATQRAPLLVRHHPDLTATQRVIYLALSQERKQPTVRLRFATLGMLLLIASVCSLGAGYYLGR